MISFRKMIKKKPTQHIELSLKQWDTLKDEFKKDYPRSIILTSVMKRELGFTPREHTRKADNGDYYSSWETVMHLDFYDDVAKSFFILKYVSFLHGDAG